MSIYDTIVECVILEKYFSHQSLIIYWWKNTINRWETEPTRLDQSNYLANQQQVLGFAIPFTNLSIHCKNAGPKPL
jgi:hypothetical protein